jgi:hypothetical protein
MAKGITVGSVLLDFSCSNNPHALAKASFSSAIALLESVVFTKAL